MKTVKQLTTLPVRNMDDISMDLQHVKKRHSELLPSHVRCLVSGPSSSGKTNLVFSLLLEPNGLKYENIYIFSKSLFQSKYMILEEILSKIEGMGYYPFTSNDEIMEPSEAKVNSVFIFDDVSCEKQNNIRAYFAMGRHKNTDVFLLNQTYSNIPKQLVRDNANLIILFKQDEMNLKHVYKDHVNTDMSFNSFLHMCAESWQDKHSFIVINKDCEKYDGRYRRGFDNFFISFDEENKNK